MLHHVNMTETITSTTELSQRAATDLKVLIYTPNWMNEIPNTEIDPIDLINTQIKNGTHGKISSYVLMSTMLEKIETGANLKTALDAADDLNELYTAYDIEIDRYKGRWIMMVDCHPTRAEIVVDLNDLVNW